MLMKQEDLIFFNNDLHYKLICLMIPLTIYLYQLCPTVYIHDSGELITASYVLGIPHPAGSPLYCIAGKIFQYLFPIGNIAFRMNAMSAFFASLSALLIYKIIFKMTSNNLISLPISLFFSFSKTFWSQALVSEVYTMATFLFLLALNFIVNFSKNKNKRYLFYFAFCWGLLLSVHMEYSLLTPFLWLLLFLWLKKEISFQKSLMLIFNITLFFIFGLVPYLYLPIRSIANPIIDWGNPETIANFFYHITAKNVQRRMFTLGALDYLYRFWDYLSIIITDTASFGLLGIISIIFLIKKKEFIGYILMMLLTVDAFFIIFLDEVPIQSEAYGIPSVLSVSLALYYPISYLEKRKKIKSLKLLLPILLLLLHFNHNNRNSNFIPYDYNLNMLYQMPRNSILFTREDNRTFIMLYLKAVENRRKDLIIYDTANNVFHNPYEELFFLLPSQEVLKIRENIEGQIIYDNFNRNHFVFYTDPDVPYETKKFIIQPCGLLGLALPSYTQTFKASFCDTNWIIRGENDKTIKKDWMTKAILAMHYYNLSQYFWAINLSKAINYLEKASSEKKYYAELHFMIGRSYMHNNYPEKALEEFEIATKINRRLWQAYVQSSYILASTGKYQEAIERAKRALKINEDIAEAYEIIALSNYKLRNFTEAERNFQRAAELEPFNPTYLYNLSNYYLQTNQLSSAEAFLSKQISYFPNNEKLLVMLSQIYRIQGKWQDLISIGKRLIFLSPQNINYHFILAEAYIKTGDYDDARKEILSILNIDPNNNEAKQMLNFLERNP